ncbi:MAG: alpha-E domain-containing protein [Acidimicrobiales bacterium]
MLSRHAEDLYWLGRHLERAADTARMLDVTFHALLESPPAEAAHVWHRLLETLHLATAFKAEHDTANDQTVPAFLVTDASNEGSIISAVWRARENARGVRELLSTELWEAVNSFWLEIDGLDVDRELAVQPYSLLRLVRRRCQEVAGAALDTMSHDDGWRFLSLGSMIERAEVGVRLLRVRFQAEDDEPVEFDYNEAVELLKCASGLEAFRRTHPGAPTTANLLSFLLLAPTFPRSVLYSVAAAESQLGALLPGDRLSRPQRVIGRLRADLEFTDVHELLGGPTGQLLDRVLNDVRWAAELIGVQFFRNADDLGVLHAVEASS